MKLNWFSPVPPARTDIANYTARVLPSLARRCEEVKVWATHSGFDPSAMPPGVSCASCVDRHLPWPEINFRDHTIYQVGNDLRFHGPILRHLERHGGVVVLHETHLHEVQRMRFLDESYEPGRYLGLLSAEGGDEAAHAGRQHLADELPAEAIINRYALTGSVLRGAHGVIAHTPAAAERVRALTAAPVACLPLPYSPAEEWPEPRLRARVEGKPIRLVMFGFLHGPNRRLRAVLEALSACRRKGDFVLDLFGEISPEIPLDDWLRELELERQVQFHGFADEATVHRLLQEADLALNLRNPTRGEASGSLLRIWSHALPCVVSAAGLFAELPKTVVTSIPTDAEEVPALANLLDRFAAHPEPFFRQGLEGRAWLALHHTPEAYVDRLLSFLGEVERYRGRAYLEHYLPAVAQEAIAQVPVPAVQNHWCERVAEIFHEAFQSSNRPS